MRRKQISQHQHEILDASDGDEYLVATFRWVNDAWAVDFETDYYSLEELDAIIQELRRLQNATDNP